MGRGRSTAARGSVRWPALRNPLGHHTLTAPVGPLPLQVPFPARLSSRRPSRQLGRRFLWRPRRPGSRARSGARRPLQVGYGPAEGRPCSKVASCGRQVTLADHHPAATLGQSEPQAAKLVRSCAGPPCTARSRLGIACAKSSWAPLRLRRAPWLMASSPFGAAPLWLISLRSSSWCDVASSVALVVRRW